MFSIPLTGNITELGGITFGAGRFGRMANKVLAPNGDWLLSLIHISLPADQLGELSFPPDEVPPLPEGCLFVWWEKRKIDSIIERLSKKV